MTPAPLRHVPAAPPDEYLAVPEADRPARAMLDPDLCMIDRAAFFVLGAVAVPVRDEPDDPVAFDAWVRLGRDDFRRTLEEWETPGREAAPPADGTLATRLPGYPDTRGVAVRVHTRPVGERPRVEVVAADHPLAADQREGIPADRASAIVSPN